MAAVVAATVTAARMIRGGENHQAVVKIKVAGPDFRPSDPTFPGVVKLPDALATDAGAVAGLGRNAGEEFVRNANRRTPAWAFVGSHRAELAIIWLAAQRTTLGSIVR
jgi:hypothetical protein